VSSRFNSKSSYFHPVTPHGGNINHQPLRDNILIGGFSGPAGPFRTVSDFHDWYTTTIGPRENWGKHSPHPLRSNLPDDVPIVFTHNDLHPSNILLSRGPNPNILAVIDWQQSGWYPAYWEYCKARWSTPIGGEWEEKYLPMFVDRWPDGVYDYWDYFVLARGV